MNFIRRRDNLDEKGYTLYEAMMAVAVLVIGLVGLLTVVRRGLVSDVEAWDKMVKTNIALSRIEEHKAQVYGNFVPGMDLPVIVPAPTVGPTPGVGFHPSGLVYSASNEIQLDCTTNAINCDTGYGVSFATPNISPTYYYGTVNASPTPAMEWISVNNRAAC